MYGDGCLILLVDEEHAAKFSHSRYALTACATADCYHYRKCYQYIVDDTVAPDDDLAYSFRHVSTHYHPSIQASKRFSQLSRVGGERRGSAVSRSDLVVTRSSSDGMFKLLAVVPSSEESSSSCEEVKHPAVPKLPLIDRTSSGESSSPNTGRSPSRTASISPGAKQFDGKKKSDEYSPKAGGSLLKKVLGGESEVPVPRGLSKEVDRVDAITRKNSEAIQTLTQQVGQLAASQNQIAQQMALVLAKLEQIANSQK